MACVDAKKKKEARRFIDAIHSRLQDEFERYKDIHYNPNTKGANYEKVIADLLKDYLGAKFNIHNRSQLIDANMDYLANFDRGSVEVDIIGTFKTAVPNLILKIVDTELIPYDAVGFLVEVAKKMEKEKLEEDLTKLQKIGRLAITANRFGLTVGGNYLVDRPLRILFYVENDIAENTLNQLLVQFYDAWDAVMILNENKILVNMSLKFAKALSPDQPETIKILGWGGNAFMMLLLIILTTTPTPLSVNVIQTFINLDTFSKQT
jgi:hypothetical protein